MTPYLTPKGRCILFSTAVLFLSSSLTSEPLLALLAFCQVSVLVFSLLWMVPAALALDRRRIHLRVRSQDPSKSRTTLTVGTPTQCALSIENPTDALLRFVHLKPFGADALRFRELSPLEIVASRGGLLVDLDVQSEAVGRWMLHGFDVSIRDPLGLIETKDYLPCMHAFESLPQIERNRGLRKWRSESLKSSKDGRVSMRRYAGQGSEMRDLREYQSGDPLRHIAWKATVRTRQLVSKNYEPEVNRSLYLLIDISSSMRGGQRPGQKLQHVIQFAAQHAQHAIARGELVGLMTYDDHLLGHLPAARSSKQMKRILRHLMSLPTLVEPELTEFDDVEVEQALVDYLLVQERLDFRKGTYVEEQTGINRRLLQQWLRSVLAETKRHFDTPVFHEGRPEIDLSPARQFAQLRGIELPYRVEARLGLKERGLLEAFERLVEQQKARAQVNVLTDLCGIMNLELVSRAVKLASLKGHALRFLVPFTPAFYEQQEESTEKYRVLRELFTSAEREERFRIVHRLQALGVTVEFLNPGPGTTDTTHVIHDEMTREEKAG